MKRKLLTEAELALYGRVFGFKPVREWQKRFLLEGADIFGVDGARRTGKSEVASFRILAYAAHFLDKFPPDDYPQLSIVPEMEQHLTFTKLLVHLTKKPNPFMGLFKVVRHPRPALISNITGLSVVEWKSEGYDKGRSLEGHRYAAAYIDEASYVSEECVFGSVYPMLADYNGQLILLTKPYGGTSNWVYRLLHGEGERPPCPRWSPNLLEDAPTPTIREWALRQKGLMPERLYKQEILGQWVEDSEAVFDKEAIARVMRDTGVCYGHPNKLSKYQAGVDVAVYTDYTAVVVVSPQENVLAVVDTLRFNKEELGKQAERIADYLKPFHVTRVQVDCTHVGEGMPALLKAAFKEREMGGVIEGVRFGNNKRDFIGNLQSLMARDKLKIAEKSKELLDELRVFSYKLSEAGTLKMEAPKGKHDDLVMALALAVWNPLAYTAPIFEQQPPTRYTKAWWDKLATMRASANNVTPLWRENGNL